MAARRPAGSSSYNPKEEALPESASDSPLGHGFSLVDASACLSMYVVHTVYGGAGLSPTTHELTEL